MRLPLALAAACALTLACSKSSEEPPPPVASPEPGPPVGAPPSINDFLARGAPTFVVGTAGDEVANRAIAAQVHLVRDALFAGAEIVADTSIDLDAGPAGWPQNPVVYGGPHVNALLARLAPALPFELTAEGIVLGEETFAGPGHVLIAVVPAGASYPPFLLFAGTGTPGIGGINAGFPGTHAVVVGDAFGMRASGRWGAGPTPVLDGPRARRIEWRPVARELAGAPVTFQFPAMLEPAPDQAAVIEACLRGLASVAEKLGIESPAPITVYIHPDRRSKESLTGDAGDGHAVVYARALHVIAGDPAPGAPFEQLVAHEGTHLLAYEAWGPEGSALLGEGLAVWVSGAYGGVPLEQWRRRIASPPPARSLLGAGFRALPEAESYPLAGLLVEAAIARVGLAAVREHLYGAPAERWDEALARAGTTAADLDEAVRARVAR